MVQETDLQPAAPRLRPMSLGDPLDETFIQEFLDCTYSLTLAARNRLGEDLATRTAHRIGAREPLDPVRFLERVMYLQGINEAEPTDSDTDRAQG